MKSRPVGASIAPDVNGTIYMSFLIRVSSVTTSGDYCVGLRTTGGSMAGALYVRASSTAGNVNFGLNTAFSGVSWSGNFALNTTHLIVIRYDVVSGSINDDVYLWVNPSLNAEPTLGSANVSATNQLEFETNTFSGIALRQAGGNTPDAQLDAFRVAYGTGQANTAANSAAAWSNLSPQGIILPVTLGEIRAYEKQNGIRVDWKAYQESNLAGYDVQRSADGRNFTTIGNIPARNVASETTYEFFDATPLPGVSFYRLKSNDFDGKSNLSNIVRVSLDKSVKDIVLYPNPVRNGSVSIQSSDLGKGNYTARIFNAGGQQVYTQRFNHNGGAINQSLQLPASVRSGMYTLQLDNDGVKVMSRGIVVQ